MEILSRSRLLKRKKARHNHSLVRVPHFGLNASTGSRFAAFHAGKSPKVIPIPEQTTMETVIHIHGNIGGRLNCNATILPIAMPVVMPIRPPASERKSDSKRN